MSPFAPNKIYPHGVRASYTNCGCRCEACSAANLAYNRDYWRLVRAGDNPRRHVPAEPSREHLIVLAASGIGKRRVHELSGVALSVVEKIRSGERHRVRYSTEQAILAVEADDAALGALVAREAAEAVIARLRRMGWRRYQISQACGNTAPSLQVCRGPLVLRRTVRRLEMLEQLHLRGLVMP